jgi:hypothetical protein
MRALVVLALVVTLGALGGDARADSDPVRVNVQCEQYGRTKACPSFMLGFVDEYKVLLQSPRANADVIVYVNAIQVALVDRLLLRFVGTVKGAPSQIQVEVDLDSRGSDDDQRAQLKPAFLRGIALFVAARYPTIVDISLGEPEGGETKVKATSPWDVGLEIGGFASKTGVYQNYSGWSSLTAGRVETRKRFYAIAWGNAGLNRQPPLEIDGQTVSTNTYYYNHGAQLEAAWLYNHCYSIGGSTSTWRDDPYGQFRYGWDAKLGVEWDKFRADDPRGNRLALAYIAAYTVQGYNLRNELNETFAHFPLHKLVANGSLRKDKVTFGLQVEIGGEMIHPLRRHALGASPSMEIQLGARVDLSFSFSITKRKLPGPHPDAIDPENYQQLSRLSYAEPLSMNGSFNLRIHWDRTNGQRNDRLDML